MEARSKIESSEYTDLNRVIRWFIFLRWIASAGVVSALVIGRLVYKYRLPYEILFALTAALLALNLAYTLYFSVLRGRNLSREEMAAFFHTQVISDYVLLFLLVYFTGFLANPFVYYFVFHIMLTSFIFPRRTVAAYVTALVAVIAVASVLEYYGLLPRFVFSFGRGDGDYRQAQPIRTFALCSTLLLVAYMISSIKGRIEERGHRIELELDRYRGLDRAKSSFILQVTHELRGPIAAMKGYHEMILKGITGEATARTKEMLERANHRTQNLLNIVDEMIDFAYLKSEDEGVRGSASIELLPVLLYNVDLYSTMAKQKDIRILTSATKGITVSANRDLLNIIIGNLLTNAIKYSGAGTTVNVNAAQENNEVHLLIKDQGMGIEPNELEEIFEEFYRTRRAREIEPDGTGLGLSIVQKAVNLLDGRIAVYSELNRGTSFHIYLPKGDREQTSS